MSFDAHKNLAYSLVATAPSPAASGTSLTVTAGQGTRFPAVPFNATVWAVSEIPVPTNAEIVRVTNIAGDVLTITRAQEGTSARTIIVGDQIAATVTAKTFTDIETQFAGTNSAITGGSLTVNTSGISINLPAYLTTAMLSNAATISNIKVSAGAASANLSAITFSNSNGLAFGLNGSTITGSYTVPTVTAGSDTFGMSNLGNTSGTSGVISGDSVRLLLAGGNNVTLSQSINGSSATITISAAAQTAGSDTIGISNLGNTSGTSGVVSGDGIRYLFAGGNNITLSQSINGVSATVTISGANAGGAQTGISGIIVSDATYTSGTVSFSNAGNITISSSVNGATQYIKLSGNAAQTNQSAIKAIGVSNTGNTLGNTGVSTGIDWVFAASGAITASESTAGGGPNTVWYSVAAQTNQSAIKGFGASNTGNTAGNTGLSTGIDWVLAGSNNITISQSTVGGGPNTLWVSGAAAGGAQTAISGLVVSDTTYTSGTVSFSNAGNITISSSVNGATQYVRLSVAAQSNQSAIKALGVSNTGNTAGNTGLSTGIDWVFAGSGAITASQSTAGGGPNTVWYSVAAQTTQSAIKGFGASNTGNTAGNTGLSTGIDWVLAGSNNITISQSTVGGGPNTLWVSGAAAGGAQTAISGIVVSDTTYTSGTVSFSNAGNITISSSVNGATQYIKLSGNAAQTNQSAIKGFGVSNTGNTLGNTGISTGIDWVIAASGAITASQSTAGGGPNTVWVSVAAQSNQSAIKGFGASNTGNTAGNTGLSTGIDWVLAGSNNITISQSTVGGGPNTLWVSGAAAGGAQTAISGMIVSDATYTSGTVSFSNAGNITISSSVNGATQYIRLSVASQTNQTLGLYALGNTTQNSSSTFDARTLSFNALGAMTIGYSASSIQVSAPATSQITGVSPISISTAGSTISVMEIPCSEWAPYRFAGEAAITNSTLGQSSLFFYPVDVGGGRIRISLECVHLAGDDDLWGQLDGRGVHRTRLRPVYPWDGGEQ
jgi:hypothetical protein